MYVRQHDRHARPSEAELTLGTELIPGAHRTRLRLRLRPHHARQDLRLPAHTASTPEL